VTLSYSIYKLIIAEIIRWTETLQGLSQALF
jgi:hypothetical protein